jgi:anti-sigma B factor antagonist
MALTIEHRELAPDIVVVAIAGKIMLGRESQALETLVPELISQGYRNFIFDIGGVNQIDSTGIGRFIAAYNQIAPAGGNLLIVGAASYVREGFHVTRLDQVFQFYPDIEAARAALHRP